MTDTTDWASATEQQVLEAALRLIPLKGWSRPMVLEAGRAVGLSAGETELLLPNGAADLAALLSRRHDAAALAALGDPAGMKIRERISAAVEARLDAACADEAAVRRWTGFLALPPNLALGARLLWDRLTSGKAAAMKHVAARIENVMAFEKWKAGVKPQDLARDVAVALGKIRYR
jgi:ubiquinone biosynthesis protein COQ9